MPVRNYSLFKGWVVERQLATFKNPHYQIHAIDSASDYRISINVFSSLFQSGYSRNKSTAQVEFVLIDDFQHPITTQLEELEPGLYPLDNLYIQDELQENRLAIDYIRGNYFDPGLMKPVPFNLPGPNNDLNEYLDKIINQALSDREVFLYAFGSHWGPEKFRDKIFGFRPGNGLHNIHMNQGNDPGRFASDNGVWQDGALFLQFAPEKRWIAIFLKFQQQSWHTWDNSGYPKHEGEDQQYFLINKKRKPGLISPTPVASVPSRTRRAKSPVKGRPWKLKNKKKRRLAAHF